jgi:hypothetical protein
MAVTGKENFTNERVFRRGDRSSRAGQASHRRALLLVEMCMSLVVMSLVLGGIAMFSLALSTMWQESNASQATCLSSTQATLRVAKLIRAARMFGYCQSGNVDGSGSAATLVFWAEDGDTTRGTSADSKIQESEVGLLQYNATTHTLDLYEEPLTMPVGSTWASTVLYDPTLPATFKHGLTATTISSGVQGVHFSVNSSSPYIAPTLKYDIKLLRDGQTTIQSGVVSLRGPSSQPAI